VRVRRIGVRARRKKRGEGTSRPEGVGKRKGGTAFTKEKEGA